MVPKGKTLPKDFSELCRTAPLDELIAVFDACEVDARSGPAKETALHEMRAPDGLIRWLVANGLDIDTPSLGYVPQTGLQARLGTWASIEVFLELGATVPHTFGTVAKAMKNPAHLSALVDRGLDPTMLDEKGRSALRRLLTDAENAWLTETAASARRLLDLGVAVPDDVDELVTRLGERFEFFRDRFDPDGLPATERALHDLYGMFGVTPVPRRTMHDGVSPITVDATDPRAQFNALTDLLVPASGPAATVQGEVIRAAGKISDEIWRNGGINWDSGYRAMVCDFGAHVTSGTPLTDAEVPAVLASLSGGHSSRARIDDLRELAVAWVLANPQPIPLERPSQGR